MNWWPLIIAALFGAVCAQTAITGEWRGRNDFTIDRDDDPTAFAIPIVVYGGGCFAMVVFFVLLNWSQIAALF